MSNTNTSGNQPAFPTPRIEFSNEGAITSFAVMADGMTLRDYFAAKAMQGIVSRGITDGEVDRCASNAYKMADAMTQARGESK